MKIFALVIEIEVDDNADEISEEFSELLSNMENLATKANWPIYDTRVEEV